MPQTLSVSDTPDLDEQVTELLTRSGEGTAVGTEEPARGVSTRSDVGEDAGAPPSEPSTLPGVDEMVAEAEARAGDAHQRSTTPSDADADLSAGVDAAVEEAVSLASAGDSRSRGGKPASPENFVDIESIFAMGDPAMDSGAAVPTEPSLPAPSTTEEAQPSVSARPDHPPPAAPAAPPPTPSPEVSAPTEPAPTPRRAARPSPMHALAGLSPRARQTIGWVAALTLFQALCVWSYALFVRSSPGEAAAREHNGSLDHAASSHGESHAPPHGSSKAAPKPGEKPKSSASSHGKKPAEKKQAAGHH